MMSADRDLTQEEWEARESALLHALHITRAELLASEERVRDLEVVLNQDKSPFLGQHQNMDEFFRSLQMWGLDQDAEVRILSVHHSTEIPVVVHNQSFRGFASYEEVVQRFEIEGVLIPRKHPKE